MTNPEYFDIHSHLNFFQYRDDRAAVIDRMKQANVWTITVGTDLITSRESVELAEKNDGIFATIGVHPDDDVTQSFDEKAFGELVSHPKVVAIGECGLDYSRLGGDTQTEASRQKAQFELQIEFAIRHDKPLMIHCRDAYPDILDILRSKKKSYGDKLRGNFHFFTSPVETARQCLDLGFTVSFTGPITFTTQYDEVVSFVPLDRMMAETDAPFAAPVPYRGKRNEPAYVVQVVKKIAQIKGIDEEIAKKQLVTNALGLFFRKISSR